MWVGQRQNRNPPLWEDIKDSGRIKSSSQSFLTPTIQYMCCKLFHMNYWMDCKRQSRDSAIVLKTMTITDATYPIVHSWSVHGLCYSQSSLKRLLVTDFYTQYIHSRKLHWSTFDRDSTMPRINSFKFELSLVPKFNRLKWDVLRS